MSFKHLTVLVLLALFPLALAQDADTSGGEGSPGDVITCRIEGMVDEGLAVLVDRVASYAPGAKGVVFVVDTPGGRVDSAIEITKSIEKAAQSCPTIAYIEGMGAISAGALISFSCQHIVMAPGTNIGAAAPVMLTPEGPLPTGEKEVSYLRSKMRALAEKNGHNPDIGEAMVDKDVELREFVEEGRTVVRAVDQEGRRRAGGAEDSSQALEDAVDKVIDAVEEELPVELNGIRDAAKEAIREAVPPAAAPEEEKEGSEPDKGRLVLARGKLLTLTTKEAEEYGLIPISCKSMYEVLAHFDLEECEVREIDMTWSERAFRWLTDPTVAGILLLLGVGGLYFEIKTPGFGVPGVVGILCLTLFFGSRAVLGLSDWIDIALVITGVALIIIELFVLPGFGVVGILGILCLVTGIVLSFTLKDFEIPEYSWDFDRLKDAGQALAIALTSFVVLVAVTWKLLPYTPMYRGLVLRDTQDAAAGFAVQTSETSLEALGQTGVAVTMLRPAGRGRFGERTMRVVSRGEFIEPGTPIVIVQAEGNRYVVDKLREQGAGQSLKEMS